jgi:enterochelin esterase-like enzyme
MKMIILAASLLFATASAAQPAQAPPKDCRPQGFLSPGLAYRSVEPLPDGRVTFRICAPDARKVMVTSNDVEGVIPIGGPGLAMTMGDLGVWSVTTEKPVAPDTYRFNFNVDGARVPDPMATTFSEERTGINSTFEIKGPAGEFQTWKKDVAHGQVASISYWSDALGVQRRAHVYLPPGYEKGAGRYPVLYLVHGAGDSDDSWTSVGHANLILDNLIASGRARPMIIVMPFGHTPDRPGADLLNNTDFAEDLFKALIPYVEARYRVIPDADHRAMAGLSMGGMHTLRNGLTHPETFHWIGIFSIGMGFSVGPAGVQDGPPKDVADYEQRYGGALDRGSKEFKLVYYAIGKDDFLYKAAQTMRGVLDRHHVAHVYNESRGGHTWINWRRYLDDFAPRLFK